MVKVGCTGLQLGVKSRREWKRPQRLRYKRPRVEWEEERFAEHDWGLQVGMMNDGVGGVTEARKRQ